MKTKKTSYLLKVTIIFYAVYAVKCVWLAFATEEYFPAYAHILQVATMGCLPLGLVAVFWQRKLQIPKNIWLLILPYIYFLYGVFNSYETPDDPARDIFTLCVIAVFIFFNSDIKVKIFNLFYWTIQVCNIVSLTFFILYLMNINIGFDVVPYYSKVGSAVYIKWFVFAIFRYKTELRLCGIFNEPGALGTVCALLFVARFRNSRIWEKIVLIASVLCTYSLAGYLLLFIFCALYLIKKNPRNIVFLVLFMAAFLTVPYIDFGNEHLNHLAGRFAITNGRLAGDNRTKPHFDKLYKEFMQSRIIRWGKETHPIKHL